jgi:hypothetical protein
MRTDIQKDLVLHGFAGEFNTGAQGVTKKMHHGDTESTEAFTEN